MEYPKDDNQLVPSEAFARNQNMGNRMEEGNWQNTWMGDMAMGECQDRQRKACIVQTNYKHFQGKYGRLWLDDVDTCHGFLQKMFKFEEVNSKTFSHNLSEWFVNKRFGHPWQLTINIIHETPNLQLQVNKHGCHKNWGTKC